MKRQYYAPLLLAGLLLLIFLTACGNEKETPPPPDHSGEITQDGDGGQNGDQDQSGALRLLLPEGPTADLCAVYFEPNLSSDMQERTVALTDGSADIVALSPQTAAELFRGGTEVQVIAVSSPGERGVPDSMECLVALRSWLEEDPARVDDFLAQIGQAVPQVEDAYLSTGWDMLDLVQSELEAQYLDKPTPDRTVPDSGFFYLPGA